MQKGFGRFVGQLLITVPCVIVLLCAVTHRTALVAVDGQLKGYPDRHFDGIQIFVIFHCQVSFTDFR